MNDKSSIVLVLLQGGAILTVSNQEHLQCGIHLISHSLPNTCCVAGLGLTLHQSGWSLTLRQPAALLEVIEAVQLAYGHEIYYRKKAKCVF